MAASKYFDNDIAGVVGKFDDPFLLPSSAYYPESLSESLEYCRFLYFLNPIYTEATLRVISHFITDFDYPKSGDGDEKDQLDDYLIYRLKIPSVLLQMGQDLACYGNAFVRIHFPFVRYLIDKRNPDRPKFYSLDMFKGYEYSFDPTTMEYIVPDPTKKFTGEVKLAFRDRPDKNQDKISIQFIDPRFITIEHSQISGKSSYVMRFESRLISDVKNKVMFQIDETPRSMLEAILEDCDYQFNDNEIFHFKAPMVTGFSRQGWGLSGVITNFRNIYQTQIYRKIDEAVALDYMLPFRLFTPEGGDKITDVLSNMSTNMWQQEISTIIRNRRRDKFAVHALPFPAKYQEFGADGKNLAPKDLIEYQTNNLLDSLGYPAELFKGSLQIQSVPTAIRLFERRFWFIHEGFNNFLHWALRKIYNYINKEYIHVKLKRPSVASDIDRQNVLLQLGMDGQIPRREYLKPFGIDDPVAAQKDRLEEDIAIEQAKMEAQEALQRKLEAAQSLMQNLEADQQGVMPGQGGTTPMDVQEQAHALAEEWAAIPSDGQRRAAMTKVKNEDFNLYSMAKQLLEDMRSSAASDGRQQFNQSMQQGG